VAQEGVSVLVLFVAPLFSRALVAACAYSIVVYHDALRRTAHACQLRSALRSALRA
jgi:hypothetical protein